MKNIPLPESYLSGQEFTNMLLDVTGAKELKELSRLLNVSVIKWLLLVQHDQTDHELIIRLHKTTGISLKGLALGQFSDVDKELFGKLDTDKIPSYEYLSGNGLASYLERHLETESQIELQDILNTYKGSLCAPESKESANHELLVRLLLNEIGSVDDFVLEPIDFISEAKTLAAILPMRQELITDEEINEALSIIQHEGIDVAQSHLNKLFISAGTRLANYLTGTRFTNLLSS